MVLIRSVVLFGGSYVHGLFNNVDMDCQKLPTSVQCSLAKRSLYSFLMLVSSYVSLTCLPVSYIALSMVLTVVFILPFVRYFQTRGDDQSNSERITHV